MNHQSLVDILTICLLGRPYVPWFVSRRRYGASSRRSRSASDSSAARSSSPRSVAPRWPPWRMRPGPGPWDRDLPGGSPDARRGDRTVPLRGVLLMLRERPVPVYIVVSDGFWTCAGSWISCSISTRSTAARGPRPVPASGAGPPPRSSTRCGRRWCPTCTRCEGGMGASDLLRAAVAARSSASDSAPERSRRARRQGSRGRCRGRGAVLRLAPDAGRARSPQRLDFFVVTRGYAPFYARFGGGRLASARGAARLPEFRVTRA